MLDYCVNHVCTHLNCWSYLSRPGFWVAIVKLSCRAQKLLTGWLVQSISDWFQWSLWFNSRAMSYCSQFLQWAHAQLWPCLVTEHSSLGTLCWATCCAASHNPRDCATLSRLFLRVVWVALSVLIRWVVMHWLSGAVYSPLQFCVASKCASWLGGFSLLLVAD